MWVKVDDGFTEHQKIFAAAELLGGAHAYARIISMTMQGQLLRLAHVDRWLSAAAVVAKFHDSKPLHVAALLVKVVLWEPRTRRVSHPRLRRLQPVRPGREG
jgi:hypothetical protein